MTMYRTPYLGNVKLIYSPVRDELRPNLDRSFVRQTASRPLSIASSISWKPGRSPLVPLPLLIVFLPLLQSLYPMPVLLQLGFVLGVLLPKLL